MLGHYVYIPYRVSVQLDGYNTHNWRQASAVHWLYGAPTLPCLEANISESLGKSSSYDINICFLCINCYFKINMIPYVAIGQRGDIEHAYQLQKWKWLNYSSYSVLIATQSIELHEQGVHQGGKEFRFFRTTLQT